MTTRDSIVKNAKKIFSKESLEGLSMRRLAADTGIALSVIYHYFPSKEDLLKELFTEIADELQTKQKDLLQLKTARAMLKQRIDFVFENAADYIFLLKYFSQYRSGFRKNSFGYLPESLYSHTLEAINYGIESKEFISKNPIVDAKLAAQMIFGVLQEYYPQTPSGEMREQLVTKLSGVISKFLS